MLNLPKDIPNKQDYPQVKKADRLVIRAAVLLGLDNRSAYALYHPAELDSTGKLNDYGKKQSDYFWAYSKNREYREAYEKCVEEFISGSKSKASESSIEIDEKRKDKALKSLLSRAMSLVEGGMELDPDTLRTIADIFKRLGILKEEEIQQEAPRRYLPETCSACKYKQFIDENVKLGNIEEVQDE